MKQEGFINIYANGRKQLHPGKDNAAISAYPVFKRSDLEELAVRILKTATIINETDTTATLEVDAELMFRFALVSKLDIPADEAKRGVS